MTDEIEPGMRVSYKRTNGEIVEGIVASTRNFGTSIYIQTFDTPAKKVAADHRRVKRLA